ncbi:hypothetical protein DSECCO2_406730 [anaerobic digester metagenome]
MGQKLFTGKRRFFDAFFFKFGHHLGFRRDGSMIRSRQPQGVLPLHPGTPHQHILNGIVEHVAHVKHSGNVGRRNHYGIWFALVGNRLKEFIVEPVLVPFVLNARRVVFGGNFHV